MPSTRELRQRIKSVQATRQMTKAMEMVSTAKMRRASEATLTSRPYVHRALQILADLVSKPVEGLTHPLITDRPIEKVLVFAISSDRGLASSYTSNLTKLTLQLVREHQELGHTLHFITMGRKLEQVLTRLGQTIVQSYAHTPFHPTSADLVPVSSFLSEHFLDGSYDQVLVIYTDFRSMLAQEARAIQLLPLAPDFAPQLAKEDSREFLYEPSPLQVLNTLLPRLLEAQLYQCLQESLASEHAARRLAMKNASDNASEMIEDLNLTYNGIRQNTITRELAEITGGAAALTD